MSQKIEVLDEKTINKIAAGEVIERPLSVVKELVENSIDAGARSISVEIKDGGKSLIRVTDNGSGISPDQIRQAFLPHATSKIKSAEDLFSIRSLGFRGEALATIAAVCRTEVISKTPECITAVRYRIEGGREISLEEIGAPDGTTFIVRDIFFNTPARAKFLRTAATEAGYITGFIQQMAVEYSDIAFKYVVNGSNKLVTSGRGDRRENIYKVYGREVATSLLETEGTDRGMSLKAYAAKPLVARNSREYEIFFVNGHYIKDRILERAVEEAYKPYLMQHKFPFTLLILKIDPALVDINVHPKKTEMKFSEREALFEFVKDCIGTCLESRELINRAELEKEREEAYEAPKSAAEPFEMERIGEREGEGPKIKTESTSAVNGFFSETFDVPETGEAVSGDKEEAGREDSQNAYMIPGEERTVREEGEYKGEWVQPDLFEAKIIKPQNRPDFRIVGQVFDTYWILEYKGRMLMIDQHAAHEKVMYEKFVEEYKNRQVASQLLSPAMIVTLTGRQEGILNRFSESFSSLGFDIEHFEGSDYALRAVPSGFMKLGSQEIFKGLIDSLDEGIDTQDADVIHDRLAQMACKAAVKGNSRLSLTEAQALLDQLLSLENPYNCPHGRPTMIEFEEKDLEKMFKRIV